MSDVCVFEWWKSGQCFLTFFFVADFMYLFRFFYLYLYRYLFVSFIQRVVCTISTDQFIKKISRFQSSNIGSSKGQGLLTIYTSQDQHLSFMWGLVVDIRMWSFSWYWFWMVLYNFVCAVEWCLSVLDARKVRNHARSSILEVFTSKSDN